MTDSAMPDEIFVHYPEKDESGIEERLWCHSADLIRMNVDFNISGAKYTRTDILQAKDQRIAELEAEAVDLRDALLHEQEIADQQHEGIVKLTAQLRIMTGALEFYADEINNAKVYAGQSHGLPCTLSGIDMDNGKKAREALKSYAGGGDEM